MYSHSSEFLTYFADKYSLTEAEYLVLRLRFEQDKSNKQIAEELDIDISAVNHRMGGIYKRLGIEGETRGKDVQLRKCLNKEQNIYCSNLQLISNTPLDVRQVHKQIQQLEATVNDLSNILKDLLSCIKHPSCPYLSNDYLKTNDVSENVNILIETVKVNEKEKDVTLIIDNLREILRGIAINSKSECERNISNKILEFLKTVSSEKTQHSILESFPSNKPELNIDAEV